MITCSRCSKTLPDWAQTCQFCGNDVTKIARPVPVQTKKNYYEPAPWVWTMYYILCAYYILTGGIDILLNSGMVGGSEQSIVGVIFGAFGIVLGAGLAFKVELARGLVNVFAFLQMLGGGFSVLIGLGLTLVTLFGMVFVVMGIVDIIMGGLLIYIIGETDRMANI